jgi:hypothetical protein
VKWLTRQEQLVLVILTGLFIVGLTVKVWQGLEAPVGVEEVLER